MTAVGPGAGGPCAELQAGESLSWARRHVGSVEDLELKGRCVCVCALTKVLARKPVFRMFLWRNTWKTPKSGSLWA